MDIGTIAGIASGFALILWAVITGGDVTRFINGPSVMIVLGGVVATLFISFPLHKILELGNILRKAFFEERRSLRKLINEIVGYAEVARRDGILSLENLTDQIEDTFIVKGLQMAVDGTDPELVEQILRSEMDSTIDRHAAGKRIFDTMGKYAPAFGMIGTLIGLIAMLGNLDDINAVGPGMAVALLTTLYGALIANLIVLPLGDKLANRSEEEMLRKEVIIRGVMSIQSGDNPRIVYQKLISFLPPKFREEETK